MTEQKKNTIITSGIAVLAVILAYCFRIVGRGSFYPRLFSYLRSFIYIGLFAAWGLSVRQRIVQKQVCRFMTVTAVLLIIWMVVRSAKYFIFWQPDAVRYLWYLFYLPMLFVADITSFENINSEIEKIIIVDELVDNWTYPLIQPKLIAEAKKRGYI